MFTYTSKEGIKYTIDEFDGLQVIEDRNGNTLILSPEGLVSSTGASLSFDRDGAGRITKITEPEDPNNPGVRGELTYSYDEKGNLASFTDQLGNVTAYHYKEPIRPHLLTEVDDPLNRSVARIRFDSDGRVSAVCNGDGDIDDLSGCDQYTFDSGSFAETSVDGRGFQVDRIFDANGNEVLIRRHMSDGTVLETTFAYDSDGNLLARSDPEGQTWSADYDSKGEISRVTEPDGTSVTFDIGEYGDLLGSCDELGRCTSLSYDSSGNLTAIDDPVGRLLSQAFNAYGRLTNIFDGQNNHWQFLYDANQRPAGRIDPADRDEVIVSNIFGQPITVVDRAGRRIDYEYDAAHRRVGETWNEDPATEITYEYDSAGQLIRIQAPQSEVTFSYSALGRVSETTQTIGQYAPVTIEYQYDATGNTALVTDSLGGRIVYEHDERGLVSVISQDGTEVVSKRVEFAYDLAGNLRGLSRYTGETPSQPDVVTSFDFSCRGCLDGLDGVRHQKGIDGTVIHDIQLVRDASGDIIAINDAEGNHEYTYDNRRQLIRADHPSNGIQPQEYYQYDSVGNRLSSHLSSEYLYEYAIGAGGNRLLQDDAHFYDYDANGNQIRKTSRIDGSYTEYMYDLRNRLTRVGMYSYTAELLQEQTFTYDGVDRLIEVVGSGGSKVIFYDQANPLLVTNESGEIINRRLYGRGVDELLAEDGSEVKWILTDQVRSVRDTYQPANESLEHFVYDSFGRLLNGNAEALNDLRFNSRPDLLSPDLAYYRARNYSPTTGRFLSEDPLQPWGYVFTKNNPVRLTDASGKATALEYQIAAVTIAAVICTASDAWGFSQLVYYPFERLNRLWDALLGPHRGGMFDGGIPTPPSGTYCWVPLPGS
jgi:RHS repeat-associated protein